jgi:hypothetical protein|tara:strand:+ start:378 stop:851 length:474 start_codon:yes stop_codon:yes gene_type:complete
MIFGYAKMAITIIMVVGIGGAVAYVYKLRADNAVLKANNVLLEQSVESQKEVIEQQKQDFQTIIETNQKLTTLSNNLQKELNDLDKRFTKGGRDFGKTAIAKDKAIERIINKASTMALRCVEISSGAPLTEKEINATKKSEINRECPSIANPNYIPY